ncbi:MAG TPA: hypothetical protein VFJ06_07990 [Halococcus sp.]|nr:hypothetical protein [Halococcus sp.]
MALITSIVVFVVSIIIGSIGIYAGVRLVADSSIGFGSAVITALLGVIVYTIFGFFQFIPILGPILLLILWIGVINLRYPGGWGTAFGIGFVAWIVSLIIMYLIVTFLGIGELSALGVPGV